MADDGMLLNFDLSNVSLAAPAAVKFKGGRWRDRNRAQRSVKRQLQGLPAEGSGEATNGTGDRHGEDKDRAAKRRRTEGASSSSSSNNYQSRRPSTTTTTTMTTRPPAGRPQNGVTSRLFTSNPEAVTDFKEVEAEAAAATAAAATDDADAAAAASHPSNAPLSDEAATFHALGLSRRIAQHLSTKMQLKAPTAIQRDALPPLVQGDSDAFLQAETGSGKTLAYLLPLVQRIVALSEVSGGDKPLKVHRGSGLFAIVLAPTRELCKQIAVVLERVLRCAPWIVSTTVLGGESKKSEKARLRKGVNILIATPGRLTDHLDHTAVLDVGTVRWLVLDEGDRLMELGFEDDIRAIVAKIRQRPLSDRTVDGQVLPAGVLPARRVTVLCSATMKMDVQRLGEISLEDAVHITAGPSDQKAGETAADAETFAAPSQLKQIYTVTPAKLRLVTLIALLRASFARKGSVMKAIVFISCADSVDYHFDLLRSPEALPEVKKTVKTKPGKPDGAATDKTTTTTTTTDEETADKPTTEDGNANTTATATANTTEDTAATALSKYRSAAAAARAAAPPPTAGTVARAAYLGSPANRIIAVHKLHGSLAQPVRTATLAAFAASAHPAVLLTTDIASRGLDVPAVDLVVEYDPAFAAADHVHRVGRTARAGRPGKAVLFLQPGCEEGYAAAHLPAATRTAQLYDKVLQQGYAAPVEVPGAWALSSEEVDANANADLADPSLPNQSWTKRAEAMQLHLEQRLLRGGGEQPQKKSAAKGGWKDHNKTKKTAAAPPENKLLEAARLAFRSHVRAYATHVREERVFFDLTQLHLGHTAKSFGLREAPTGIGGGVVKRRGTGTGKSSGGGGGGGGSGGSTKATSAANTKVFRPDGDDEGGEADADAARRMREKMQAMMKASASEFNIG